MRNVTTIKTATFSFISLVGGALSYLFGGFDMALQALIIFMIVDYTTGLIVAGVFKKSNKSENGALESKAGWKGLCKKGVSLLIVLIATSLDRLTGTVIIRDAVIFGFIANECLSIVENAGVMGLPIPKFLVDAIEVLKNRGDNNG